MTGKHGGARNYPKYRALHRLVALLKASERPVSAAEIGAELHMVHDAIAATIRKLRHGVEGFPSVRIADWRPPPGMGAHTPLYELGSAPDAVKKKVGRYGPRTTPKRNPYATRDAVLLLLAQGRPLTVLDICEELHRSQSAVGRVLHKLKKGVVPLARVRVTGHTFTTHNKPTPRWVIGNAYDVKYKRPTMLERNQKYRENNAALVKARQRANRSGTMPTPFDWLIDQAA